VAVVLVLLFSMFEPAANIYNFSRYRHFYVDATGCVQEMTAHSSADRYMPIIVRSMSIAAEFLVLVVTWMKTVDIWKASRQMKQFRPKLSMLLLRDGTTYFATLFILNILTLTIDIAACLNPSLGGAMNFEFITETISPVLIARFMLDLRSVHHPEQSINDITTIYFGLITGDLAGPLKHGSLEEIMK